MLVHNNSSTATSHADNATQTRTIDRLIDRLDETIVKLFTQTQEIDDQVNKLHARQDEIDKEIEDAFTLRNDLATVLGIDGGVCGDLTTLTERWETRNSGASQ